MFKKRTMDAKVVNNVIDMYNKGLYVHYIAKTNNITEFETLEIVRGNIKAKA